MEDLKLFMGYAEWAIVIGLTIGFFSYFSRKYKKLGILIPLVLLPVWSVITIIRGVENIYFENSYELISFYGFTLMLAETLPLLILFGGITFAVKYVKVKKTMR